MAYINVDHSKFEAAASAIDTYVETMKKNMKTADTQVSNISSAWQGKDATQLKKKWDDVDSKNSVYGKMKSALSDYADILREASKLYKNAQADAVNRASRL